MQRSLVAACSLFLLAAPAHAQAAAEIVASYPEQIEGLVP